MAVKKMYPQTLENIKKLKTYLKKLKNGRTKTNRQKCN